jgi:hypothetical protein
MQVSNHFSRAPRILNTPKREHPKGPDEPRGDGFLTAGAAALAGAGLGYAGAHGGAVAGGLLGLMLTPSGSSLGSSGLLGNIGMGMQIGAVSGALIGVAGGASLVYLISEALKSGKE